MSRNNIFLFKAPPFLSPRKQDQSPFGGGEVGGAVAKCRGLCVLSGRGQCTAQGGFLATSGVSIHLRP